jgi:hypothetical protein
MGESRLFPPMPLLRKVQTSHLALQALLVLSLSLLLLVVGTAPWRVRRPLEAGTFHPRLPPLRSVQLLMQPVAPGHPPLCPTAGLGFQLEVGVAVGRVQGSRLGSATVVTGRVQGRVQGRAPADTPVLTQGPAMGQREVSLGQPLLLARPRPCPCQAQSPPQRPLPAVASSPDWVRPAPVLGPRLPGP